MLWLFREDPKRLHAVHEKSVQIDAMNIDHGTMILPKAVILQS